MELEKALKKFLDNLQEPFVSEADFQFSLAWELKKCLGKNTEIILEYPNPDKQTEQNKYYDIAIKQGNKISFIELKYKTKREEKIIRHGIDLKLKDQQARPYGNYKFIVDIQRMEDTQIKKNIINYCIFLTNDKGYWDKNGQKKDGIDENFKLWNGAKLKPKKSLKWNPKKGKYPHSITLKQEYTLNWKQINTSKWKKDNQKHEWRYLLVKVKNSK